MRSSHFLLKFPAFKLQFSKFCVIGSATGGHYVPHVTYACFIFHKQLAKKKVLANSGLITVRILVMLSPFVHLV